MSDLIELIKAEALSKKAASPLSYSELRVCEKQLGFELPSFFTYIYAEIANGGFGPGYGLLPIIDNRKNHDSILKFHEIEKTNPQWPSKVLTICFLGCQSYIQMDCSAACGSILTFDEQILVEEDRYEFSVVTPSLELWLMNYYSTKNMIIE